MCCSRVPRPGVSSSLAMPLLEPNVHAGCMVDLNFLVSEANIFKFGTRVFGLYGLFLRRNPTSSSLLALLEHTSFVCLPSSAQSIHHAERLEKSRVPLSHDFYHEQEIVEREIGVLELGRCPEAPVATGNGYQYLERQFFISRAR